MTVLWVPEHTRVEGNEITENIAKKPFLGHELFAGISSTAALKPLEMK